ncbi:MAG: extracellular solute-binding protein [Rhodobacteraceae bacterium]|nr:extracellular solute-binding protein [Paracoccaceae bacterium]
MRWRISTMIAAAVAVGWGISGEAAKATETTVTHGLSAFGELKYPSDFTHFDYVVPDAPKGGRIRLRPTVANRTFDNFNLYILKGDAADGTDLLFDSLMARAYDEPDALYGLLAESVELPADRSYAIFTLRPEAKFADGSPVTAEDVAWSIETLRDKSRPVYRLSYRDIASAKVLDQRRVRFDFAEGAAMRDQAARVAQAPIFSKAHFEGRDFEQPELTPPLGSGPYQVGKVNAGRTVTYERREDYWAKDLPVRQGAYNFDQIVYEYFRDHDVALEAFKAGAFDFNEIYSSKNWALQYDFPAIQKGWVIKEHIQDGRPSGTQGFWINTRKEKFSDPRVREALDWAFDFEWTRDRVFYGQYERTDSFFENSEDLQASGPPSSEELALLEPFRGQLPATVFEEDAYLPPVTKGDGVIRRNLRRARKLLDEAGWTIQDGVRKNAAGEALTIEFLDRVGGRFGSVLDPYIANLKTLGIEAMQRQVDPAQYELRQKSFDYDIVTGRFVPPPTPGTELRGFLSSASAGQNGSFNLAGVNSPVIDALIEKVNNAASRDELRAAARALDRVYRAGRYWVPQWYSGTHRLAYWDMFGRPEDRGVEKPRYWRGVRLTWWYDEAKAAALAEKRGK